MKIKIIYDVTTYSLVATYHRFAGTNAPVFRVEDVNSEIAVRDFRLPPRCKRDLRSSEMLCSVYWWLVTDVSVQRIGPIFILLGLLDP